MAAIVGNLTRQGLLKPQTIVQVQNGSLSFKAFKNLPKSKKWMVGLATAGAVTAVAVPTAVFAGDLVLHPPSYPWSHYGAINAIDHSSARRGYQVYKQVCAACHSLNYLHYRELVGHIMTEKEAKAEAAEIMVTDGPDAEGNMFERPGKLADKFPRPYANSEAAKAANNGALPPDLTFIVNARHGNEDYIFSLLTGYWDTPEGMEAKDGLSFNAYFPGGMIGMPPQLFNDGIEYEDGTPATVSQMAKDVVTFLRLVAEPHHDQRKRMGLKVMLGLGGLTLFLLYMKKFKFSVIKSKKLVFKPPKYDR